MASQVDDYYASYFGIPHDASAETIDEVWNWMSGDTGIQKREGYQSLKEAYEILSDPARRAEYDKLLEEQNNKDLGKIDRPSDSGKVFRHDTDLASEDGTKEEVGSTEGGTKTTTDTTKPTIQVDVKGEEPVTPRATQAEVDALGGNSPDPDHQRKENGPEDWWRSGNEPAQKTTVDDSRADTAPAAEPVVEAAGLPNGSPTLTEDEEARDEGPPSSAEDAEAIVAALPSNGSHPFRSRIVEKARWPLQRRTTKKAEELGLLKEQETRNAEILASLSADTESAAAITENLNSQKTREDEVSAREKALSEIKEALAQREQALLEKEAALVAREGVVADRERDLENIVEDAAVLREREMEIREDVAETNIREDAAWEREFKQADERKAEENIGPKLTKKDRELEPRRSPSWNPFAPKVIQERAILAEKIRQEGIRNAAKVNPESRELVSITTNSGEGRE